MSRDGRVESCPVSVWVLAACSALSSPWGWWLCHTADTQNSLSTASCHLHSFSFLSGSPEEEKKLWVEQLLQLIKERNNLVTEEAELMIT